MYERLDPRYPAWPCGAASRVAKRLDTGCYRHRCSSGILAQRAVITEQIFAWPGIGRLTIESINARDFPVVQAITLITSVAVVGANLLVDLSYSLLDPRIRRS